MLDLEKRIWCNIPDDIPGCSEVVPEGDRRQGTALSELALTPAPSQM